MMEKLLTKVNFFSLFFFLFQFFFSIQGSFNENGYKSGVWIIVEFGKEFYVEFDEKGNEISRKRTFEGIKLMILGNK